MDDVEEGIRRATFPLPFGLDHVHCYLLRTSGGWTLVDTGLGVRDPAARWHPVLDELDGPLERIVVTHMHPDHVGGAADVAAVTGAPVLQGRDDYEQCLRAWGERDPQRFVDYWVSHGMPDDDVAGIARESERLSHAVHWVRDPQLLDPGDEIDGWRVEVLRGHADGHIVLLRDGVMIAGDTILGGITPAIGLYPNSRPDPLGDYLETLHRIEALAPRIAYAGHKDPIADPAGRAREIIEHHRRVARALRARPVADPTPVRNGRVARAPRAPRPRRPRRAGRPPLRPRLTATPAEADPVLGAFACTCMALMGQNGHVTGTVPRTCPSEPCRWV
jgi:glyoxylase-like metal-dependent hydrolase (beta-lactamase superfamily II)